MSATVPDNALNPFTDLNRQGRRRALSILRRLARRNQAPQFDALGYLLPPTTRNRTFKTRTR